MAFLNKDDIPKSNWTQARKNGYSFTNDKTILLDGWYALALRAHLMREQSTEGLGVNWYKALNIAKSDNAGTVKRNNPEFQWPNAPWEVEPMKRGDPDRVTFFLIEFENPEDLITFRLKYL
jgi:hypothetical protein